MMLAEHRYGLMLKKTQTMIQGDRNTPANATSDDLTAASTTGWLVNNLSHTSNSVLRSCAACKRHTCAFLPKSLSKVGFSSSTMLLLSRSQIWCKHAQESQCLASNQVDYTDQINAGVCACLRCRPLTA